MMTDITLVAAGGFGGALARFLISKWFSEHFSTNIPVATLFINWFGSFLLGLLIGQQVSSSVNLLCGVGFMGAFTTFSTFTLDLMKLAERKQWFVFCSYLIFSYIGGILLAFFGFLLTND